MKEQQELMAQIRAVLGEPVMTHPTPTTVALSFPKKHYHPPNTPVWEYRDFAFSGKTVIDAARQMLAHARLIRNGDCCHQPFCAHTDGQAESHQHALF